MPPKEKFPSERVEGAPSDNIGWHFADPIPDQRNHAKCKLCGKVVKGGITRLNEHIAHYKGQVAGCPRVTTFVRENMMKMILDFKGKKIDSKKRKIEFEARIGRGNDEVEFVTEEERLMAQATRESLRSYYEMDERERFRQQSERVGNIYEHGGSSRTISDDADASFRLRSTSVDLTRSQSMRQPKINSTMMKTLRKKLGDAVSKFLIYERLPMNLCTSPWLHNLITVASEIGVNVNLPSPYEVSEVYLNQEYETMKQWINCLKTTWKERGVTIMCDGWTNSINHMHIMNFLVYCHQGTIFLKSIDASGVASRNTDYYFHVLDQVVEEVGEEYVVQVVTDNEAALKAAGQRLMEKRPHLYWSACAAHCLDLCLEDIAKKSSVKKVLDEAKIVTTFIYNHIWTINLMKQYTGGREIIRPAVTRFATQFLQLESILKQKHALRNMFHSEQYRRSKFGKEKTGLANEARKIIMSKDFWSRTSEILQVFEPIVKVLKLVDGDEKPTMGFIYEAIDRAKQAIKANCRYSQQYLEIVDRRWHFMHFDLHSAGYFLNPQFQYGLEHSRDVAIETMEGTRNVISKLEPNIDRQIKALNQLFLFRDKRETFGKVQAQRAWAQMNPAEWWIMFGECARELQHVAIKVLSQTTSASNCERNWSTFSYIHTKTRNRLKYKRLQKLVFTFYNMKLKMRHEMRRSQESIDESFNPINLDYIFQEEDPLSPWLEESESPLLDGANSDWFPRMDSDDEDVQVSSGQSDEDSGSNGGTNESGSSPNNNSGGEATIQGDQSDDK